MGWLNKKTAQSIDAAVNGENHNANEATGAATYIFGAGAGGIPDPNDRRDCYQRGACSSCNKRPDYCAIAQQYLPSTSSPW